MKHVRQNLFGGPAENLVETESVFRKQFLLMEIAFQIARQHSCVCFGRLHCFGNGVDCCEKLPAKFRLIGLPVGQEQFSARHRR